MEKRTEAIMDKGTACDRIGVVGPAFNDNAYGNVRTKQNEYFDGRTIGCDLVNPDFMNLT
tara:strand:+ start:14 stop:193 length:180 start_codon:yes stop_codon:yes gene_type:complete